MGHWKFILNFIPGLKIQIICRREMAVYKRGDLSLITSRRTLSHIEKSSDIAGSCCKSHYIHGLLLTTQLVKHQEACLSSKYQRETFLLGMAASTPVPDLILEVGNLYAPKVLIMYAVPSLREFRFWKRGHIPNKPKKSHRAEGQWAIKLLSRGFNVLLGSQASLKRSTISVNSTLYSDI